MKLTKRQLRRMILKEIAEGTTYNEYSIEVTKVNRTMMKAKILDAVSTDTLQVLLEDIKAEKYVHGDKSGIWVLHEAKVLYDELVAEGIFD